MAPVAWTVVRLAALYSGGKDSTYALYLAQQQGHDVDPLVTVLPPEGSWMFQVPNVEWASLSAEALGLPHVQARCGEGVEAELEALRRVLEPLDVDGVVAGAVASEFQYSRVHDVCGELGLRTYAPLWRKDPARLLREYLDAGFRILVVAVAAEGLDATWLGRTLDEGAVEELLALHRRHGVHPTGEGGEFETWVLDGPNFTVPLQVQEAEVEWAGTSGVLRVRRAALSPGRDGP